MKESLFAKNHPTNKSVAASLGLTNAGVSRIRRANRHPSDKVIRQIERVYGWSAAEQYELVRGYPATEGRYAKRFEEVLNA